MRRFLPFLLGALWAASPATAALELPRSTEPLPRPTQPPAFAIAHVDHSVRMHARPGGTVVARVGPVTEFGSSQTLAVVEERGRWLGVVSSAMPNRHLGWVWKPSVRLSTTRLSLNVDLSRRVLLFERNGRVIRRIAVGVGRSGSPTPVGRYAVTDKLDGARFGPYYGCCILALSAHQPNLPAGWTGGNRIAVHGTNAPATVGAAASAGCLHAGDRDLRVLMRRVPLGTPVFIRA